MLNEELLKKVAKRELNEWKWGYEHGDFEEMARLYGGHYTKYSRAKQSGMATPTVRKNMTAFYADKKKKKAA